MITRSSIVFEDFLSSSIAPQVMPPCLTTTPRAASFIPLQGLGSLKSSYLGRGIFLFAWFRIFLLFFPVVLRSWQVWQWKEEIATLRNMEEENTEPGCWGSTQILYTWRWWCGSYDKCAPGNVEIATLHKPVLSHRWGYKPYYHRKISDHTQKETFSGKQSWIGLSGRFKWLVVKGREGGGLRVDSTITRSNSKRQWQPRLSRINVWNSPGKAFNAAGISFYYIQNPFI